jgi:hypothetical protein
MGQPEYLSNKDVERLDDASQLVEEKQAISFREGPVFLKTSLPSHAVAAIRIDFKPDERRTSK